jgi:hypothetical protein
MYMKKSNPKIRTHKKVYDKIPSVRHSVPLHRTDRQRERNRLIPVYDKNSADKRKRDF